MANHIENMEVGREFKLKIEITKEDGTPEDITGYKFWLTLKSGASYKEATQKPDDQAALQDSTTVGDEDADNALGGVCYLIVKSSMMKDVADGDYYYDVQGKKPDVAGEGLFRVIPPIEDIEDIVTVYPVITKANA